MSQFPDIDHALEDPNGLLAQGGELTAALLLDAYSHGIFPWPSPVNSSEDELALFWWSPDPRAVLFCDKVRCSNSLRKQIKRCGYRLSLNAAFKDVVDACATVRRQNSEGGDTGTWITPDIQQAYIALHQQGHAHSIEVWDNDMLVGGLYGVVIGQLFCGESMFHYQSNASKMALLALAKYLSRLGWPLIDCQIENPHLESLGATLISREEFKAHLPAYQASLSPDESLDKNTNFGRDWPFTSVDALLAEP